MGWAALRAPRVRRRDDGDVLPSPRSGNAADGPAPLV